MPVTCPTCGTTYPDGHAFCSNDGTALRATGPIASPNRPVGSSRNLVGALGALTVVLTGLVAVLLYMQVQDRHTLPPEAGAPQGQVIEPSEERVDVQPEPIPPAPDLAPEPPETRPQPPPPSLEPEVQRPPADQFVRYSSPRMARVQTATDGRILLRSSPDGSAKTEIYLDDGTQVSVSRCQRERVRRTDPGDFGTWGRWCLVRTGGIEGWAFDPYLIFR